MKMTSLQVKVAEYFAQPLPEDLDVFESMEELLRESLEAEIESYENERNEQ